MIDFIINTVCVLWAVLGTMTIILAAMSIFFNFGNFGGEDD